jgi:hypothetical protein
LANGGQTPILLRHRLFEHRVRATGYHSSAHGPIRDCFIYLALLKVYEDASFFHVVYHGGVFEALDDRKKLALLNVIREQVATKKLQYFLTLIHSDIPRDADGNKINFADNEIILRLHGSMARRRGLRPAPQGLKRDQRPEA